MPQALRALKSRNYRLFFIGQAISLVGTWMDSIAMQWWVYNKTGSTAYLGVVAFCSLVPAFFLGPFAGVMIDRFDKRKLLLVTQSIQMAQAATISVLVFTNVLQAWMIACLAVVAGLTGAVDMPARQAYMVHLVDDREDLSNAIALNSSQFNLARLIGPIVAGFVYNWVGPGYCFAINSASFLAVLTSLYMMTARNTANPESRGNILDSIRQGANYVNRFVPVRSLIILLAVVSFLSGAQSVMMPVLAKVAFHGDAKTLGLIQAAIGGGALASALVLASRKSVVGLGKWIVVAVCMFGTALITISFVKSLPLALLVLIFVGAGVMAHMAATNTLVQTVIDDKMRGRVMAFYVMSFTGTMPFGSLLAGWSAERLDKAGYFGAGIVLATVGSLCVIAGLVFLRQMPKLRTLIRPVYLEKGVFDRLACH
jgi:MFS family permease